MSPRTLAAGILVLLPREEPVRVLVLRAYRNWDIPKGLVEPGEKAFATARRETAEETGLIDLEFPWGEEFRDTAPYGRNKVVRVFLATTPNTHVILPVNASLGRPEHHEFRWVDFGEAHERLPVRYRPILDWAAERALARGMRLQRER